MFKIRSSDLIKDALDFAFDAIGHGCNCFCSMGAGIAVPIKQTWPGAYKADAATQPGCKNKLGSFSKFDTFAQGADFTIYNLYTQYNYGRGDLFTTERLESCLEAVAKDMNYKGIIGVPLIGGGLGKGNKEEIIDTMRKVAEQYPDWTLELILFN